MGTRAEPEESGGSGGCHDGDGQNKKKKLARARARARAGPEALHVSCIRASVRKLMGRAAHNDSAHARALSTS